MKPVIEKTTFGTIVVEGVEHTHDITIGLDGVVRKRKKGLSKKKYGTSHKISIEEAEAVYETGAGLLIIGAGMFKRVQLSEDARNFFQQKGCRVVLKATAAAAELWNETKGEVLGLFHITC